MNDRATARAAWCAIETLVLFALHAPVFVPAVRAHIGKRRRDAGRCPHPPLKRPYRGTDPYPGHRRPQSDLPQRREIQ